MEDLAVFRGKRVLVTGATGLKGSWLSLWLHMLGAEVVGFSLPPRGPEDHYRAIGLGARIRQITGDIRDERHLSGVVREAAPEFVFHLAAQALVRHSYGDPKLTFDTNIGGSVNLLEAVRACDSVRVLIFVTSDKCYKNREWVWGYRESDELGGQDPYSASKAAAEMVFDAYGRSFFAHRDSLGAASVRAGNVIGGGDWSPDRILPDCIRSLQNGEPIRLRNPNARRPWQHVLEPLSGYLLLASRLYEEPQKYAGAWNFGPDADSVVTVSELVRKVIAAWGHGEVIRGLAEKTYHEADTLCLNCDKARHRLGWRPRWDLNTSVQRAVQWYQLVGITPNPYRLSTEQIEAYRGLPAAGVEVACEVPPEMVAQEVE